MKQMKQSRKEKEELELEQQRLMKEAANRVKFRGGASFARTADMGAVAERLRARAAAMSAPPPDVTLQQLDAAVAEGAGRAGRPHRNVPIALPADLAELERFAGGAGLGPAGPGADGIPSGDDGEGPEMVLAPPLSRDGSDEEADEEDAEPEASGGMVALPAARSRAALASRAAPGLLLRLDSTQVEADGDDADWKPEAEEAEEAARAAAEIASDEEAAAAEEEADEDEDGDDEAEEASDDDDDSEPDSADVAADSADVAAAQAALDPEAAAKMAAERRERAIAMIREEKAARAAAAAAAAADGAVRLSCFLAP
jgi:hypothetical protein